VAPADTAVSELRPPEGVNEHFVSLTRPSSFEAEQYRLLHHAIEQLNKDGRLKVIAVTSPAAEDGKTTTAVNLAAAMAQRAGAKVLLADVDLRRPSVAPSLGLGGDEGPGLVGAIRDPGLSLQSVVRRRRPFEVSILPAGLTPAMPYELLQSPRLGELLAEARREYDHIVVDTPPFLLVPDSRLLEALVDGFLLVVAANKTPRRLVGESLNEMDKAKLLGLVFNGDARPLSSYYGSYYSYRSATPGRRRWWRL
jgi:capsular exopolysaccharide synthesis family protein